MDSILNSVKKVLGMEPDYTHFDQDIILFINATLMTVNQLGIGPEEGFSITDDTAIWSDFIGDKKDIDAVQAYVSLKVRMLFDPPTGSAVIESMERTLTQLEWRLNIQVDKTPFVEEVVIDDE